MSKFYKAYCMNNSQEYINPEIVRQENAAKIHKAHINQANQFTTGKHTGSKSTKRLKNNVKIGTRNLQHTYNQYTKAGIV